MGGVGVIFDMDGTLTRPQFDFDAIRREIGLTSESLLEAIAAMPADQRNRAEKILHRYEAEFAVSSELQDGAADVVHGVQRAGFRSALMTRNSRTSVSTFQARHGLRFDAIWTREDGPSKPSPVPVQRICAQLCIEPARTWVVGDYLFDLQSGRAAGARTVLLINEDSRPSWADMADVVITSLADLLPYLDGAR